MGACAILSSSGKALSILLAASAAFLALTVAYAVGVSYLGRRAAAKARLLDKATAEARGEEAGGAAAKRVE